MDKIQKVSIGGVAFTLEFSAFRLLEGYLNDLSEFYSSREGGEEILDDIEERIAELISEYQHQENVVSTPTIQKVIHTLGSVKDLCSEESSGAESQSDTHPDMETSAHGQYRNRRRLYRNPYRKVLGGVLGGMAVYFHIDPAMLRVCYALLTLITFFVGTNFELAFSGIFFLIYAIFWISTPMARTVAQKDEMYGRSGHLKDIERGQAAAQKRYRDIRDHQDSPIWGRIRHVLEIVIGVLLMVISLAAGISLIIVGILSCKDPTLNILSVLDLCGMPHSLQITTLILGIAAISLPFLGMLYGSIALLFKVHKRSIGLGILILWLVSILGLAIPAAWYAEYRDLETYEKSIAYPITASDSLKLDFDIPQRADIRLIGHTSEYNSQLIAICGDRETGISILVFPDVSILHRDSSFFLQNGREVAPYIHCLTRESTFLTEGTDSEGNCLFHLDGKRILISPREYNHECPIRPLNGRILIFVPKGTDVDSKSWKFNRNIKNIASESRNSDRLFLDLFF